MTRKFPALPAVSLMELQDVIEDFADAPAGSPEAGAAALRVLADTITVVRDPVGVVAPALVPAMTALLDAIRLLAPAPPAAPGN